MACKASFALHHNFPKLAEEAGFAFNTHRPRVHIEWNKIRLLDIESLIREKKFVLIEQHINDILDCLLESEFDVRILDEGVVKIFRLAQLAVEYQQFCRHYLDRSVYVLREEVTALAKELENHKRNLREKEDEMRRLRKKSYHHSRTSLPVTNENIATMILSSLKNQSDIFSSAAHLDTLRNNKCQYCDKVFLNQLYLKSHLSRRHPNVTETPQKDIVNDVTQNLDENYKLHSEIENLKSKLSEMEVMMSQTHKSDNLAELDKPTSKEEKNYKKEFKDAEVLTQNDAFLENRLDDYRKHEFEKYDKELSFLRTQITLLIDAEKNKKNEINVENDDKKFEKLQATIEQQSEELVTLKQELLHSKYLKDTIESEKQREIELQMAHWTTKAEAQSNECKMLLQKLHDSTKEVHEYKGLAEREREKASKLQELLDKQQRTVKTNNLIDESPIKQNNHMVKTGRKAKSKKSRPTPDRASLEKLQKQAQDLLNIVQSTTDLSSSSEASNNIPEPNVNIVNYEKNACISNTLKRGDNINHYEKKSTSNKKEIGRKTHHSKLLNGKRKNKKIKNSEIKENGQITAISPIKVVRAKITEEVHQRLIQLGVDPLKKRLPKNTFQKQRTMLQKQQELKSKKYPSREKMYHCILTHLDTNTTLPQGLSQKTDLTRNSPGKTKIFSLASVISNVKTRALSLVKSNEALYKKKTNNPTTMRSIRAPALLKTPPSSMQSSPTNLQEVTSPTRFESEKSNTNKEPYKNNVTLKNEERGETSESDSTDDSETESEHVPRKYCKKILDVSINHQPNQSTLKKTTVDMYKSQFISQVESDKKSAITNSKSKKEDLTSDDIESIEEIVSPRKAFSEENLNPKQTKGVLRNASSTSSLNKKKVLFDMDAIQMKSISASPSQSLADKSDDNEKYTLGIINLDADDWDPSSIENGNHIKPTIQVSTRTTPKIAELKQAIESQMARRVQTPSTVLAGSVNILPTPIPMARTSLGGSNTSLGSSILDESDNSSITNKNTSTTKNKAVKKDDSEIDFSELLADDKSDNKF